MALTRRNSDMLLLQAWIQLQYGHPERARILLEALLSIDVGHIPARRALIVALLHLEKGTEAQAHCDQLLSHGENSPALWLCLSNAHQLNGCLDEARAAYQHYLSGLNCEETDEQDA